MKIVLVAPYFPPSNLAAVHRCRLIAKYLPEFGIEPIVLTVDPAYYEEPLDLDLAKLLPETLQVIRTPAFPTRPLRLVGDISLRSFWFHYRTLCKLVTSTKIDLLFFSIPPNYSCLLGTLIKRRFKIPYVVDYQDPWVFRNSERHKFSLKGSLSRWLAQFLEPIVLRDVDALTSVAPLYFASVFDRHPHLKTLPNAAMPVGDEPEDHEFVRKTHRKSSVLSMPALKDKFIFAYGGVFPPTATRTFEALFTACKELKNSHPDISRSLHLLFVGTGARSDDPTIGRVTSIANYSGAKDLVTEVIDRQPYLEILSLLDGAQAALIMGLPEAHYTPSKVFQVLRSRKPILAMLHESSAAVQILNNEPGTYVVTFSDEEPIGTKTKEIKEALEKILRRPKGVEVEHRRNTADDYSARLMTKKLAEVFREVIARRS